jgi:sulfur relay (sulfurtransferase) complex TusBCD TusD component (DsrE family)
MTGRTAVGACALGPASHTWAALAVGVPPAERERTPTMARKLGLYLSTSPEHENTHTVIRLTEAALERGHEVDIFIMCDGVHNAVEPAFEALAEKGARIVLCSHNLAERHRPKLEGPVVCGSQYDHAQLVQNVDRYLAFN